MGPWNVSWPAAQACRHLSQRIRFSLQSSLLSPCFVRNFAWAGRTSRTSELLGHRQPSQSSKGCQNNQAGASSPQDSNWDATGRRNASAPRQPGSPYQISRFTTCRRTWDSGISLFIAALRGDAKGSSEAAAMPSAAAESENTCTPSSSGELPGPDEALDVQK